MKKKSETFKFRLSYDERHAITNLATRLQRSQSDAVRFVIMEAARQLGDASISDYAVQKYTGIKQKQREKDVCLESC